MLAAQVLILFAALSTCDPGNIMDAVKAAKEKNVRVSIVGVAAEVRICSVFKKVAPPNCHQWCIKFWLHAPPFALRLESALTKAAWKPV